MAYRSPQCEQRDHIVEPLALKLAYYYIIENVASQPGWKIAHKTYMARGTLSMYREKREAGEKHI